MSNIAVEVNLVSKKFRRGEFHDSLRDFLPAFARRVLGRGLNRDELGVDGFWALQDVSFQVKKGEVLGIIGANGAGKSTLLKILSKIIKPTKGHVRTNGRLRALIEVAAGFHQDLTGRENIYLNGTILGMSRREIDWKFDEIVDFSGIEPFLDTPVKRYSSGMYARLGFAVAAHLDPEILIVDEVLAVGDFAFQHKCIGKMQAVAGSGRTVLFVSHNMAAVGTLCTGAIALDHGRMMIAGEVRDVIKQYYDGVMEQQTRGSQGCRQRGDCSSFSLRSVSLCDENGAPTVYRPLGGEFRLRIGIETPSRIENPTIGIGIDAALGMRMLTVHTPASKAAIPVLHGPCQIECVIPVLPLSPGEYIVKIALSACSGEIDVWERALVFTVMDGDPFGEGRGFQRGVCVAPSQWTVLTS